MIRSIFATLSVIVFASWGSLLAASDLPKTFAVVEVGSDDVLNIRAEPNAQADILGAFRFNASGLEVVALSDDGKWGQVNIGETIGWTSMRYLTPLSDEEPLWMGCFGVEPFWGLVIDETGATSEWATPETRAPITKLEQLMTPAVMPRTIAYAGDLEGGQSFEAVMTYEMCSDGMADNLYGLSIKLRMSDGDQELSGCCTLQR